MTTGDVTLEQRRNQFLTLISAYSEDRWAAGWCSGVEEEIRTIGGIWTLIAAGCGGWPKGYEGEHGWDPLTNTETAQVANYLTNNT